MKKPRLKSDRVPNPNRRAHTLGVRFSDSELTYLNLQVDKVGASSVSAWIRHAALNYRASLKDLE